MNTIWEAEGAIRKRLIDDRFRGELRYDAAKIIETDRWWYIPFTWIGCAGFIVNKEDLYVNWLGSALTLEQCFWGQDHGVYCDLVDFEFAPDSDTRLVQRLVAQFKHMRPNAKGVLPKEEVWYRESEILTAISEQFPTFRRHFVWHAIPELFHASENEGLRFSCVLARGT